MLFVGSLNEEKVTWTLEIFNNIIDFIPKEVVFIIIGDGEIKYKIEDFIKNNQILKQELF